MVPTKLLSWLLLLIAPVVVFGLLVASINATNEATSIWSRLRVGHTMFDASLPHRVSLPNPVGSEHSIFPLISAQTASRPQLTQHAEGLSNSGTSDLKQQAADEQLADVDVSVSITVFPSIDVELLPSQPVVYSLFIANNGPISQSGILVSNLAPLQIVPQSIISTTNGSTILPLATDEPNSYRWQIDNLDSNQHVVIYMIGRVDADLNESLSFESVLSAQAPGETNIADNVATVESQLQLPKLSFQSSEVSFLERPTEISVTVQLDPVNPYGSASVDFESTTSLSASAVELSTDFEMVSGTVDFDAAVQQTNAISVTLYDDLIDEDNESFQLVLSNPRGATLDGDGQITITIEDDDQAGVTASPPLISLAEGGATGQYQLVLDTEPISPVVVEVQSFPQIVSSPEAVTFTSKTWNIVQTVNVIAVDDEVAEGVHNATIAHNVSSADPKYQGLDASSVTSGIVDNDRAGFNLDTTVLTVTEGVAGSDASSVYVLNLDAQPTQPITVVVEVADPLIASPTMLHFSPETWTVQQSVVVSAIDDFVITDVAPTIQHRIESNDPAYSKVAINDVTVNYIDNDSPGLRILASSSITVSGALNSNSYDLLLNTAPQEVVTIRLRTDAEHLTVVPDNLSFGPDNWDQPQTVIVTLLEDGMPMGTNVATIEHSSESADPIYNQLQPKQITVEILGNADLIYLPYVQGEQVD